MAGARIYTIVGIIIFTLLGFWMFRNYFEYIKMDYSGLCLEQGGEWRAYSQECIFPESNKEENKKASH